MNRRSTTKSRTYIGPSEQAQPRRSERIRLQQEKTLPSRLVTRSQARKSAEEYCIILAYEDDKDKYLETFGTIPNKENQEFNEYFAISACAELVEEKSIEDVFATQDLVVPTTTTESLKDPIWKKSMNKEYEALIEKKLWCWKGICHHSCSC